LRFIFILFQKQAQIPPSLKAILRSCLLSSKQRPHYPFKLSCVLKGCFIFPMTLKTSTHLSLLKSSQQQPLFLLNSHKTL